MAGAPGGLTASIRRKLQEGKTPDDIVQELVAGGLGQVSAQRFVDRAMAEDASGALLPPPPPLQAQTDAAQPPGDALDQFIQEKSAETQAAAEKTGRKSLWVASVLMCSGIVITAGSYLAADVGERYTLMWGPVVFGFLLWGKAVLGGLANARSFAWFSAVVTLALPVLLTLGALGAVAAMEPTQDEILQAELTDLIKRKNTSAEAHDARERAMDDEVAAQRATMDVDTMMANFDDSSEPREKCVVAAELSRYTGEHKTWVVDELSRRIDDLPDMAKVCAARAINELDRESGLRLFSEWSRGDNPQLKSAAITMSGR